tara:strand:+ start:267 stop:614 length:348 start_codon:yes stop_codon:yes gene_type:complete
MMPAQYHPPTKVTLNGQRLSDDLDRLASAIKGAADLWDLRDALVAFEVRADRGADGHGHLENDIEVDMHVRGLDITDLPTFGGEAPPSTAEVWSWDEGHLLVGIGPFADWEIRAR